MSSFFPYVPDFEPNMLFGGYLNYQISIYHISQFQTTKSKYISFHHYSSIKLNEFMHALTVQNLTVQWPYSKQCVIEKLSFENHVPGFESNIRIS